MKYHRVFWVQASHFNRASTYERWRAYHDFMQEGSFEDAARMLETVLADCHGHNFKVEVWATGPLDGQSFVVEDEKLEEIVQEWDNCNLSILEEFGRGLEDTRVSLEAMVDSLMHKLWRAFPEERGTGIKETVKFRVRIWETPFINAEAGEE